MLEERLAGRRGASEIRPFGPRSNVHVDHTVGTD